MKYLILLAVLLLAVACVTFTPEQVATFSNDELCSVYARGLVIGRVNEVVAAEFERRKLECPPEYIALAKQRIMTPAGSGLSQPAYSSSLSCTPPGNNFGCWTW